MINYEELAKQFGGTTTQTNTANTGVDYSALAKQFGGTTTIPTPIQVKNPSSNPYQSEGVLNSPLFKGFDKLEAPFKSNEGDSTIKTVAKTVGNMPASAINLATGIFDFLNPVKNISEAGKNISDIITEVADYSSQNNENPLKTIGKSLLGNDVLSGKPGAIPEIYKSAGKVLLPKFLQDIISGNFEDAKKSIAEHPVEEIAPLVLIASGVAEKNGMKPQFDKLMKDISSPVVKPVEAGINLSKQGLENVKTGVTNNFIAGEKSDWAKPTTKTLSTFNKSRDIYSEAKSQGHDIADTLVKNKIKLQDNVQDGKFSTIDTADRIRQDAGRTSFELLRPTLEEFNNLTEKVPVENITKEVIKRINSSKNTTAGDVKSQIAKATSEGEALAEKYPNGMSLTDLHDEGITYGVNGGFRFGDTPETSNIRTVNRAYDKAFSNILKDTVPKEVSYDTFQKELSKLYQTADYLESLNNKKVPVSIASKIAKTAGKVLGASAGVKLGGGVLGGVGGYHIGGIVEGLIEGLPNPIKNRFLDNLQKTNPEVFSKVADVLSNVRKEKGSRLALPPGNRVPNVINLESPEVVKGKKTLSEKINLNNGEINNKIDERLIPLVDKDGMVTVYRASSKFPKKILPKETFVSTKSDNARYYAESWYKGNPSNIKIKSFNIPASLLKRGGSNDTWQLNEDFILGNITKKPPIKGLPKKR